MQTILSVLIIAFAGLSAVFWFKATNCDVLDTRLGSPGMMLDGHLAIEDRHGRPIDLAQSLAAQSKWNRHGAFWACATAIVMVIKECLPWIVSGWMWL